MTATAGSTRTTRLADGLIALSVSSVFLFCVLAHRGVMPALCVAGLAVAVRGELWREGLAAMFRPRSRRDPFWIGAVSLMLLPVWIAIGSSWSPQPGAARLALMVLVVLLATGALVWAAPRLGAGGRVDFSRLVTIGASAAAIALLLEAFTDGWIREIVPPADLSPERHKDFTALARGLSTIILLAFPAMALIWRLHRNAGLAVALLGVVAAASLRFSIEANTVALGAGALAYGLALLAPRATLVSLLGGTLAGLFVFPWVAAGLDVEALTAAGAPILPVSWLQRLVIWKTAASAAFNECAPFGCGADFARTLMERSGVIQLPGSVVPLKALPYHPHNIFIELWLELGLPGVLLVSVGLLGGGLTVLRKGRTAVFLAAVCGLVAAALVLFMVETSLWREWRLASIGWSAFACALIGVGSQRQDDGQNAVKG